MDKLPTNLFSNSLTRTRTTNYTIHLKLSKNAIIDGCNVGELWKHIFKKYRETIYPSRFQNGCAIGPASIAPFLGLAIYGFDFAHRIPLLMNIVMKTSFIRCGVVAMVLTIFGFGRTPLECKDVYCHFAKPDVLLKYLDIERTSVWFELAIMISIMLVFRSLCFIGLKWRFATWSDAYVSKLWYVFYI